MPIAQGGGLVLTWVLGLQFFGDVPNSAHVISQLIADFLVWGVEIKRLAIQTKSDG